MSERRKSNFDDHLNLVKTANAQTPAARSSDNSNLLSKLAAQLGLDKVAEDGEGAAGAAAQVELNTKKTPAEALPTGANPATVAATEQLATPQVVMAGGNPAEAAAGEVPKASGEFAASPVISSGTGDAQTAQTLNKTDEAVAAAARGAGGAESGPAASQEKTAAEAEQIGKIIAKSFREELEKQAADQEYAQALDILEGAGLLSNYDIKDRPQMAKTASVGGGLEKIANNQQLSRTDIVSAAAELLEHQKLAADAEEEGRSDARAFAALMSKVAEDAVAEAKKEGETVAAEKKEEKDEKKDEKKEGETEKMAALLARPEIRGSVKILREAGLI